MLKTIVIEKLTADWNWGFK